jgi:hypothetical protein
MMIMDSAWKAKIFQQPKPCIIIWVLQKKHSSVVTGRIKHSSLSSHEPVTIINKNNVKSDSADRRGISIWSKEKIKRAEGRMSEVKTNKEYQALLSEMDTIKEANSRIEEEILQVMDEIEELKKDLSKRGNTKSLMTWQRKYFLEQKTSSSFHI